MRQRIHPEYAHAHTHSHARTHAGCTLSSSTNLLLAVYLLDCKHPLFYYYLIH